jgi:hypothetical protein
MNGDAAGDDGFPQTYEPAPDDVPAVGDLGLDIYSTDGGSVVVFTDAAGEAEAAVVISEAGDVEILTPELDPSIDEDPGQPGGATPVDTDPDHNVIPAGQPGGPGTADQPGPRDGDAIVVVLNDGSTIDVGPATIDTDNDNIPDAVSPDDHTLVVDADHDGRADHVIIADDTGHITTDVVTDPTTGQWVPATDGDTTDATGPDRTAPSDAGTDPNGEATAPVRIPPEYVVTVDPSEDLVVTTLQRAQQTMTEEALVLWQAAYPGQPWPADDTGHPYPPEILLGWIANDHALERTHEELVDAAQNGLDTYQRIVRTGLAPN